MAPVRIPGVPYAAAPSAEGSARVLSWPPRLVVVHDTGNPDSTKENEASYAHTRPVSGATTAHAYIDNGGALGSLRLDRQAWAAYSYANANGLHVEMCLRGDRTKTRQITAALVRQLCQMAGIPMVKLTPSQLAAGARGVCGHRDVTSGLGVGDHTDPGADFPWSQFMAWVNQATANNAQGGSTMTDWESVHDPAWNEPPNGDGNPRPLRQLLFELWDTMHTRFSDTAAKFPNSIPAAMRRQEALLVAIAAKVDIDAAELAAIQESARVGAANAFAAARDQFVEAIVQAVSEAVTGGTVEAAAIEAAVRRVFADAGTQ